MQGMVITNFLCVYVIILHFNTIVQQKEFVDKFDTKDKKIEKAVRILTKKYVDYSKVSQKTF